MKQVSVISADDEFVQNIQSLQQTFSQFGFGDSVLFDFIATQWVSPLQLVAISAYINKTTSHADIQNSRVENYLEKISFPECVSDISHFDSSKSYIPLTKLTIRDLKRRSKLEEAFQHQLLENVGRETTSQSTLFYPIDEFITNVSDHSDSGEAYLLAQYYPNKGYIDVCIADTGRGIASTYIEEKNQDLTDAEALKLAVSGYSTKPSQERGYGLRKNIEMITEGLEGSFTVLSGNAGYLKRSVNQPAVFKVPEFYWQGVLLYYRVRKPDKGFDFYRYVE